MSDEQVKIAVVHVARDRAAADSASLVLEALAIPHAIVPLEVGFALATDAAYAARAVMALDADERERAEAAVGMPTPPDLGRSYAGLAVAVMLLAFFWVTGGRDIGGEHRYFAGGAAIADRIVRGEWWRTFTALTLHADLAHVAGNAIATWVFLSALGRWLGGGLTVALVVLVGALGNLLTAHVYGAGHSSVGASTATFGALGLLGGLQALHHLKPTGFARRRKALGALGACLGLFAMLGVGERSDVVAHLAGLAVGFGVGLGVSKILKKPLPTPWQLIAAVLAAAAVAGAWALALR